MRTLCLQFGALILAIVAIASSCAHASAHKREQGILLDTSEYDWCHYDCFPFDRPTLFFCVQVNNRILIGSRGADWRWMYDSSQMFKFRGKPVSLRYDDGSIWIVRTDGKDMHLRQDYSKDVFRNSACSAEIHRHWLQHLPKEPRPNDVPSQAILVPRSEKSYFYVDCTFDSKSNWDLCSLWDEKGRMYGQQECVDGESHRGVVQSELTIDPLTTTSDYQFHLKNGVVLADWAKGRINNKPISGSIPPLPPLPPQKLPSEQHKHRAAIESNTVSLPRLSNGEASTSGIRLA